MGSTGFGVSGKTQGGREDTDMGTIYWDDIRRLQEMDEAYNRPNRYGPFGGWEYTPTEYEYDKKGRPIGVKSQGSQKFVATDPGMQAAQERMSRRLAGEGFTPYEPPAQVSAMTDALMASRMERMGLLGEGTRPNLAQENYGTRFGDRQGGAYKNAMTTPPPGAGGPPPGQGGPPPGAGGPPPGQGGPPGGIRPPGDDLYLPPGYWNER